MFLERTLETGTRLLANAFDGLAGYIDKRTDELELALRWLEEANDGFDKATVVNDLHGAHLERECIVGTIVQRLELVFGVEERIVWIALLFDFLLDLLDVASVRILPAWVVELFVLDTNHLG